MNKFTFISSTDKEIPCKSNSKNAPKKYCMNNLGIKVSELLLETHDFIMKNILSKTNELGINFLICKHTSENKDMHILRQ